jgi:hypothetical protein
MAADNHDYRQIIHDLVEAARLNINEHEKLECCKHSACFTP